MRMMELTNREIATLFWTGLGLGWGLTFPEVRQALSRLVRAAMSRQLMTWFSLMGLYAAGTVWALARVGLWTPDMIKETTVWFLFTAVVGAGRSLSLRGEGFTPWGMFKESVAVLVLAEFIISSYTLSLPGEIALVGWVTAIGLLEVGAEHTKSDKLASLLRKLIAVTGLTVLTFSISAALGDLGSWWHPDTLRRLVLLPALALLLVPFLLGSRLYAAADHLFCALRMGPPKSFRVRWYAKLRCLFALRFNANKIQTFHRTRFFPLSQVQSCAEVDALFREVGSNKGPANPSMA
jgi:hypothetical protein